jgi:hypothetical protein
MSPALEASAIIHILNKLVLMATLMLSAMIGQGMPAKREPLRPNFQHDWQHHHRHCWFTHIKFYGIFSGTNGFPAGTCYVLSATNPSLPLLNRTREATNTLSSTSFSFTNPLAPGASKKFYRVEPR